MLGVLAAGLLTAALAGRGDDLPDLPPDAVARVGGAVITKSEFDRGAEQAPRQGGMGSGALRGVPYDPPDYAACVATKEDYPAPAGGEKSSDEKLREECREEFEGLMPSVMESLIEGEWIRQEAHARRIKLGEAEVASAVEKFLERQDSTVRQIYADSLRNSGVTREEMLADTRLDMLEDALVDKATARTSKISNREIQEHYDRNGQGNQQPERRDLLLVLARTKGQADAAKTALRRGATWRGTAQRYSVDATSRARGGKLPGLTRGEYEEELERAAFSASEGVLEGPVKTQFGWYVFEVTRITAAGTHPPQQAKRTIKRRLQAEREQTARNDFYRQLGESYRPRTVCATDFKVPACDNSS
jgi:foldase protein PrsA